MGLYIAVVALIILLPMAFAAGSLAPWVPTRAADLSRINSLAALRAGQRVYELGAGNGRVSLYLARRYPGNTFVAVERAWPLALLSWFRSKIGGDKNVSVKWADLFKSPLHEADIVYVFGMPEPLKLRLKLKLEQELRPGARLISYAFPLDGLKAQVIDTASGRATIYAYDIPFIQS